MKTCLSSRCEPRYLKAAQEIKVAWGDRKIIPELVKKYKKTTIILHLVNANDIDWTEIEDYKNICKNNFICATATTDEMCECSQRNIKFYYGYPINTFYELQTLKVLGVCYVRLGIGLFFNIDKVNNIGIPVRAVPNVAYTDGLPRINGIVGHWIRPEDILLYQNKIETIEFEDCNVKKEQALYRIYTSQQGWHGDINDLITNLNYPAANKMLPNNMTMARLNCGQKCQINGQCQICYRAFNLADPKLIKNYIEEFPDTLNRLKELRAEEK